MSIKEIERALEFIEPEGRMRLKAEGASPTDKVLLHYVCGFMRETLDCLKDMQAQLDELTKEKSDGL